MRLVQVFKNSASKRRSALRRGGLTHAGAEVVVAGRGSIGRSDLIVLFVIRGVAIAVQTLACALAAADPNRSLPLLVLGVSSVLFVVSSLIALAVIRRNTVVDDAVFFQQILIDIAVLTYLLALSGGTANPYHNLYVLPVTIAAVTLPAAYAWCALAGCIAGYTMLEFVHFSLPANQAAVEGLLRLADSTDHVLIAVLVCYLLIRVSQGLRERDRQLAEAHQREVQAGCAISLGSVAAGAAHELATPLATISTVIGELRAAHAHQPELSRSLELLEGSFSACQRSLAVFRSSAEAWMKGGEMISADRYIEEVIQRFRAMRPEAAVTTDFTGTRPGPLLVPDPALQQAIVNLLNNAAFVSPLDIRLTASWDAHELHLQVADKGPGISKELVTQLGRVLVSTKPPAAGNGVGLFLTNVTISRLGGRLRLFNAADGGAIAQITVPLTSLQHAAGARHAVV